LLDRDPKAAIALFEKANKVEPMRPDLLEVWVQALFQDNRLAEGDQLAWQVIAKYKTFRPMYDVLYRQYMSAGRTADAESVLKAKVQNNPKQAGDLLQLARHYSSMKNDTEKNGVLQRITQNPTDFPQGPLLVGNFYASTKQWDLAYQQFEQGARSNSKDKLVYERRMTDALLAQGKTTEAAQVVDQILKEKPDDADAKRVRASLLLASGSAENGATAVSEAQALVKERPNDAQARTLLGKAYLLRRNPDAARSEFLQVMRLRPEDVPARLALASIGLNQGRADESLKYANQVLARNPENGAAKLIRLDAMMVGR